MGTSPFGILVFGFFPNAIAMSERRIALGSHANVSAMLELSDRGTGTRRSSKAVGGSGWVCWEQTPPGGRKRVSQ